MKPKILTLIAWALVCLSAKGQVSGHQLAKPEYSLEQCIKHAIDNNLNVKQTELNVVRDQITADQSKYNLYPTLNGSFALNSFAGRNINPFTNDVITSLIGSNNYGLNSSVVLFDNKRTKNDIEIKKLNVEASKTDVLVQKNNISLQVALAYLNILSQEEQIEAAKLQRQVTQLQLERTQKLVDGGSIPATQLLDIQSQIANDDLNLVNAQNNLEVFKLNLKQLMNINEAGELTVQKINLPNPNIAQYQYSPQVVYETALSFMPEIRAIEIRQEANKKNVEIAKAAGMPQLVGFGSWGTTYTTAASKQVVVEGQVNQNFLGNVDFNGQKVPLVIETPKTESQNIGYGKQITGNMNGNFGVSLRIPIFNGYAPRYQMQTAKLQQEITQLQLQNSQLQIRQNIEQAFVNLSNAAKRYSSIETQVKTLEETLKASTIRFEAGSLNSVEYNIAKTNLDRARTSMIQSKYEYVFRTKILDFYMNKSLTF